MHVISIRLYFWLIGLLIVCYQLACFQPMIKPSSVTGYQDSGQAEEKMFNDLYSEMKLHIDKANSQVMELYYYEWIKLGSVGWITGMPGLYVPDRQEYFWVNGQVAIFQPLSDELPGYIDAAPLVTEAENCLHVASPIWSDSPYKQKLSSSGKADQSFIYQWRTRCKNLILYLTDLEKQLADYKFKAVTTSFKRMENILNRWEWAKENYLPFFKIKSAAYMDIIDKVLIELAESKKLAANLMAWDFISLSTYSK
jgi:hypothetical protein